MYKIIKGHLKNWSFLKRTSIIIILFVFIPFSYGISQENKVVVNIGGARFYGGLFSRGLNSSPPYGLNVNVGVKSKFFANGIYYGYNQLRKFELVSREEDEGKITKIIDWSDNMANFHSFGVYSTFYLSSLIKSKDFFMKTLNFYATAKLGGYYVPAKDIDCTAGFNFCFGQGAVLYLTKRIGIFGEIGLDYFSYMDYELNRFSISAGISIRI